MKVLHINSYYPQGYFYKNLYDRQVAEGMDIKVFASLEKGLILPDFFYGDYTTIHHNFRNMDRYLYFPKQQKIFKDLLKTISVEDYQLTHCHSLFTNGYIGMKLKEKYGIPYMVAVRSADVDYFFPYMPHLRKQGRKILENADHIVFLSSTAKTTLKRKYIDESLGKKIEGKSSVIPNGIHDFWMNNINEEKKTLDRTKEIKCIFAGDILKQKNIHRTIKGLECLRKCGYNITFTLVGKGSYAPVVHQIKSKPWIHHIPFCSKEELIEHFRNHHIFLMHSHKETFGLVYVEAMSQGLPLGYSSGEGFSGMYEDGIVGYMAPYNKPKEMGESLLKIMDRYEELSENGKVEARKFTWGELEKTYRKLYLKLI